MIRAMRLDRLGDDASAPGSTWWARHGACSSSGRCGSRCISRRSGRRRPGSPLLWPDHEFNIATDQIAKRFGGVDSFVVFTSGDRENASADPLPIKRMTEFERWMQSYTHLGASVSIAPIIRGYWRMNHYGDPKWQFVPEHPGTVRTVIFQLRTNGAPGFLRPFMTDDSRGRQRLVLLSRSQGRDDPPGGDGCRRLHQGKPDGRGDRAPRHGHARPARRLLATRIPDRPLVLHARADAPDRARTRCTCRCGRATATSTIRSPCTTATDGMPRWIDEFREAADDRLRDGAGLRRGRRLLLLAEDARRLEHRATWTRGGRARSSASAPSRINTNELLVQDLKAVEPIPRYQQTSSWTRGVQFVMAGGIMGILAAINDEVERSHIANITLILFVIFVLHSRHLQIDCERRDHPAPDLDGHPALARLHGDQGRGSQHQHAAGAVGRRRHRRRLRDLHRGPHTAGVRRHQGHRRSGAARGPHHRHGRELHGHDDRRRHLPLELLEPALPGRDGAAAGDPDDHQHARRDHRWCRPSTRSCARSVATALLSEDEAMLLRAQKEREQEMGLRDDNET